jgi:hypothetical protein
MSTGIIIVVVLLLAGIVLYNYDHSKKVEKEIERLAVAAMNKKPVKPAKPLVQMLITLPNSGNMADGSTMGGGSLTDMIAQGLGLTGGVDPSIAGLSLTDLQSELSNMYGPADLSSQELGPYSWTTDELDQSNANDPGSTNEADWAQTILSDMQADSDLTNPPDMGSGMSIDDPGIPSGMGGGGRRGGGGGGGSGGGTGAPKQKKQRQSGGGKKKQRRRGSKKNKKNKKKPKRKPKARKAGFLDYSLETEGYSQGVFTKSNIYGPEFFGLPTPYNPLSSTVGRDIQSGGKMPTHTYDLSRDISTLPTDIRYGRYDSDDSDSDDSDSDDSDDSGAETLVDALSTDLIRDISYNTDDLARDTTTVFGNLAVSETAMSDRQLMRAQKGERRQGPARIEKYQGGVYKEFVTNMPPSVGVGSDTNMRHREMYLSDPWGSSALSESVIARPPGDRRRPTGPRMKPTTIEKYIDPLSVDIGRYFKAGESDLSRDRVYQPRGGMNGGGGKGKPERFDQLTRDINIWFPGGRSDLERDLLADNHYGPPTLKWETYGDSSKSEGFCTDTMEFSDRYPMDTACVGRISLLDAGRSKKYATYYADKNWRLHNFDGTFMLDKNGQYVYQDGPNEDVLYMPKP